MTILQHFRRSVITAAILGSLATTGAKAQTCDQVFGPLMTQLDQSVEISAIQERIIKREEARFNTAVAAKKESARDAALMLMLTTGMCDYINDFVVLAGKMSRQLAQPACKAKPDSVREAIRKYEATTVSLRDQCKGQIASYEKILAARLPKKN